ncbi:TolC family protein [Elusimicrobiota bacterium]
MSNKIKFSQKICRLVILITILQVSGISAKDALKIGDFLDSAMEKNYDLLISRQSVIQAEGQKKEAWGRFFPNLSASYSYNYMDIDQVFTTQFPMITPTGEIIYEEVNIEMGQKDNYKTMLSMQAPIFTFGGIRSSYLLLKHAMELEKKRHSQFKQKLTSQVKKAYYSVLLMMEIVEIAKKQKGLMEENLETTKKLYERGKSSNLDVSRVTVQLAKAESGLIEAGSNLKIARENLFNISGINNEDQDVGGKLEYGGFNWKLDELIEIALKNRQELSMASLSVNIQEKKRWLDYARNLPKIYATAGYIYEKPYLNQDEWGDYWIAGGVVEFPFLDGLAILGRKKKNTAAVIQAETRRDQLEDLIELQVKSIYYKIEQAEKKIAVQQENKSRAEENLNVSKERYARGLLSNLELNQSILDYTSARVELYSSIYNYLSSLEDMKIAIGKEMK